MPNRRVIKKSNQVGGWGGRPTTYYSVGGSKNRNNGKSIKRKSLKNIKIKSKKQIGGWGGRTTRYYGIGGSIKNLRKKKKQRNQRKTKKQNKNFMFRLLNKYFD
mgnify:CR=1 FL=1